MCWLLLFGKRGEGTMAKKKVVLFIVEGVCDEMALALPLEKLFSSELVKVEVYGGDITSDYSSKSVVARVGDCVKKHSAEYKYQVQDYAEVVLLTDMDGAYISEDLIRQDDSYSKAHYSENGIRYCNPERLHKSHLVKQQSLNQLISLDKVVRTIPFSVYFFACNLDHVLSNNANLLQKEKMKKAEEFRAKYVEDEKGFLVFFHSDVLTVGQSYIESWSYVKKGTNSLKRCSNFNIYLSSEAKQISRDFSYLLEN